MSQFEIISYLPNLRQPYIILRQNKAKTNYIISEKLKESVYWRLQPSLYRLFFGT